MASAFLPDGSPEASGGSRHSSCALLEPRVGLKRIVDRDLLLQRRRKALRHHLVAVELPMRKIRGVKKDVVGAQMLDGALDGVGIGRRIERLDGQAEMVANDLVRRAVDPR